jgi:hypothetical protein
MRLGPKLAEGGSAEVDAWNDGQVIEPVRAAEARRRRVVERVLRERCL